MAGAFELRYVAGSSLLAGWLHGTLDAELARKLVAFIELQEAESEKGFDRFCDLTGLEGIALSVEEVASLAARRRAYNPNPVRVRSAFLVASPLALGVVHVFKALLQSERIEVRWFESREAAAAWLGVSPETLRREES